MFECHSLRSAPERHIRLQRQVYLDDTYLTEIVTAVVRTDAGESGPALLLADNIFHPQGGGQPSDKGTVNGIPAVPRRHDGAVLLDLHGEAEFPVPAVGDSVTVEIDRELRRLHAALHTAGHLIDALVRRHGLLHSGNIHFPGQARIEYHLDGRAVDRESLAAELKVGIEDAITARLPVTSTSDMGQRSITIEGLGSDLCGGTHVPHLGALEHVVIRSIKAKSGRLRVGYDARHADLTELR